MNVSDEMLMAYADGELDDDARGAVERELSVNPRLALQLERHRELKRRLQRTFDPVMTEAVPERLLTAIGRPSAEVTDIASVREKRAVPRSGQAAPRNWMSIAASIGIGIFVGYFAFKGGSSTDIVARDGRIVDAVLVAALNQQSSGEAQQSPIALGISYRAKSGEYCRSFVAEGRSAKSKSARTDRPLAGVACHSASASAEWRVRMLMEVDPSANTDYRTATSSIPTAVIELVDREIEGDPLDAQAEAAAIEKGWKR